MTCAGKRVAPPRNGLLAIYKPVVFLEKTSATRVGSAEVPRSKRVFYGTIKSRFSDVDTSTSRLWGKWSLCFYNQRESKMENAQIWFYVKHPIREILMLRNAKMAAIAESYFLSF